MKVYVNYNDKRWKKYKIDFEKIACTAVLPVHNDSEVSIILTDDVEIHALNKQYRNMDKPTNVLSFELGDDILLGDIYISLDTVIREAAAAGISVAEHTAHMVVHGMLHLQGFDHLNNRDANKMERKEVAILERLGIKNPYEFDSCACDFSLFRRLKIRENGFWQYALYAVFGGVAVFGFAPFYQWWWTIIGIAGAYWLTVRNKKLGGFWKSFLRVAPFGAMYAIANFWWVLHSIYVVPELTAQFAIWTVPGIIGIGIGGVLIFSWPFVANACIRRNPAQRAFLFAAVWTLVLWLREWVFTGFPWNPIANISMPWPMIANSMSVWGALGLTFIIIGLIASVVEVLVNRKSKSVFGAFVVFIVMAIFGAYMGGRNISVASRGVDEAGVLIRMVQPGASQTQKATHDREAAIQNAEYNLRNLFGLATVAGNPDLIIFPETTYPFVIVDGDKMPLATAVGVDIVVGATTYLDGRFYNSMIMAGGDGEITQVYNKSHLVPFGEYRPLGILPAPVNLARGAGAELISVGDVMFAPAICYEIIFSDSLIPRGAPTPNAIINITNDNWFGNTPGTYQHLDMVRRYAIESGVPVVRANYSGISAFVGADGNVISALPVGASGVLDGFVWGAHDTIYRMVGMYRTMAIILVFSILMMLVFADKRRD
ncbi:MAG: apolipoprotein N-acyltransferase [Alphaproteobacteria bacterium]|nr:apolipoprotein N-acyltransferase [Alphaproteobacteria bacterium]